MGQAIGESLPFAVGVLGITVLLLVIEVVLIGTGIGGLSAPESVAAIRQETYV
jgi:hypothetical protein